MNDLGARDQRFAPGGSQIVDLELGGHDACLQCAAAREGERIVGRVADDAAMDEPVLLLQLGANRNPEFGLPVHEAEQYATR